MAQSQEVITLRRISFDIRVHAPFEVIWELMLDRIEHPPASSMKEVRVIERHGDVVVREVRARWQLVREKITIDRAKREIRYLFQEHPLLFGSATMRAVPLSRQSPVAPVHLSMVVDCSPKTEDAERKILATIPAEVENEVRGIKDEAEARAKEVAKSRIQPR